MIRIFPFFRASDVPNHSGIKTFGETWSIKRVCTNDLCLKAEWHPRAKFFPDEHVRTFSLPRFSQNIDIRSDCTFAPAYAFFSPPPSPLIPMSRTEDHVWKSEFSANTFYPKMLFCHPTYSTPQPTNQTCSWTYGLPQFDGLPKTQNNQNNPREQKEKNKYAAGAQQLWMWRFRPCGMRSWCDVAWTCCFQCDIIRQKFPDVCPFVGFAC